MTNQRVSTFSKELSLRDEPLGADWVYKNTKPLKMPNTDVPEKIRRSLEEMLRSGSSQIKIQRLATQDEQQAHEAATGKAHKGPLYFDEQHGSLSGISALREEYDLRDILVKDLQPGIERIAQMDIETATGYQLSMESKWTGEVDSKLEQAKRAISEGRRLLVVENLQQLILLLDTPEDKKSFERYLTSLSKR